ncbi:MAG: cytochrome b/b6 domain-containing protein [Candidatus Kryptonium sp.]|nr:cytochrome b/b6 domain-containing protein [Candidatus Kryptonium sp.]MCX7761868.1 cytochrome b/b6 domain-containing protein [Candidatus Kryptonium sp.]MDW8108800.1 cytochrome b/b6 domain-containing protein [Candidatus Kryptonium sp.]
MDVRKEAEKLINEVEKEKGITLDDEFKEKLKDEIAEKIKVEIERKKREEEKKTKSAKEEEEYFIRFSLNIRLQHLTLAIGVLLLIITGLPVKFHESKWAELFFNLIGGIQVSRFLHRVGAVLLIFVSIWHTIYIAFTKEGRNEFKELLPRKKDFLDFWQNIKYMLGKTNERPKYGRYSYIEKFDYWAVYWGMVIMVVSGLILWFHNFFLAIFPKFVFDIAKEAHSDEAMLATLAIVVWHWYNAHFNPHIFPFNPTIFTGKISKERMIREHPLEYEKIMREKLMKEEKSDEKQA